MAIVKNVVWQDEVLYKVNFCEEKFQVKEAQEWIGFWIFLSDMYQFRRIHRSFLK